MRNSSASKRKFGGFPAVNMKGWNLRKRILLNLVLVIFLLWFGDELIHYTILPKVLRAEFQQKGLNAARNIAANSSMDILTQNSNRLNQLLGNELRRDKDVSYIFIINSTGQIVAHTFDKVFPEDLAGVNNLEKGKDFSVKALDNQMWFVYDIAVPILSEKNLLGQVHLGILRSNIQQAINTVSITLTFAAVIVLIIGVFLAYKVSYLMTKPISKLVDGIHSIRKGNLSTYIDVRSKDEIGELATAFNEMASRLNFMVEEIKRLSVFEERNRIALDLHDGFAQDLATVIKGLELCDKLLKTDPVKASEELRLLRENTKVLLNSMREVIFGLKFSEDSGFDLTKKLVSYAKDYEKSNGIKVKLDISASLNDLPQAKAKSIFYIISEAFTNAGKHSYAQNVELNLKSDDPDNLRIIFKDDGKGFDSDSIGQSVSAGGRFGLTGMQDRAASLRGTLFINSIPDQGTEISVNIPLK